MAELLYWNSHDASMKDLSLGEVGEVNELYTVIVTASHIPTHPETRFIDETIESLRNIVTQHRWNLILAHDFSNNSDYAEYLIRICENVKKLQIPNLNESRVLLCDGHRHLTGNVRNAMSYVETKYVLLVQHDLPFVRAFDIDSIVLDCNENSQLRCIRFNRRKNLALGWDVGLLFGKVIKRRNCYTRTGAWSDQNHLAKASYYRNFVLSRCKDGLFMESQIENTSDLATHRINGTYLFGDINEDRYTVHTDARLVELN